MIYALIYAGLIKKKKKALYWKVAFFIYATLRKKTLLHTPLSFPALHSLCIIAWESITKTNIISVFHSH